MQTFPVDELNKRILDISQQAKQGHLSLVTQDGTPLFISVPFSEKLAQHGVYVALAEKLYVEGNLSLGKAAKLANLSIAEFSEYLSHLGIAVVDYTADELTDELAYFNT